MLAFVLLAAVATGSSAQEKAPPRPVLAAGADTNDATTYYDVGLALLRQNPEKAANAFYWASQLNPGDADPYYARRTALLMARPTQLVGYWAGQRSVIRDKAIMRADSLYLRALTINPFLYRKLDNIFFDAILHQYAVEVTGTGGSAGEVEYLLDKYMRDAPAETKAWRAYSDGNFEEALRQYAIALKSTRKKAPLRVERGRIFYQMNMADSALVELTAAAEELRKADKKELVFQYESKGVIEHALGMAQLRMGKADAARESFARALQEDLSYSPAHVQLGFMALEAKDTATAVSEFDLASQIATTNPTVLYQYGYTLGETGKAVEAEAQLKKATALAPFYAAPHLALARAQKAQNRKDDAIASARRFLALSGRNDPLRKDAEQLLASLGSPP
jgi:tetratricopeptide (TPR) repeat protein